MPGTCNGWSSFFGVGSPSSPTIWPANGIAGCSGCRWRWGPVWRSISTCPWSRRCWLGLAGLAVAGLLLVLLWRRPALRLLCLALFVAVLGFAAAELRTATVEAPMLAERLKGVEVKGHVREVEFLPYGPAPAPGRGDHRGCRDAACPDPAQARPRLSAPRSRRPRPHEGDAGATLASRGAGLLRFPPRSVLRPHRRRGHRLWPCRGDAGGGRRGGAARGRSGRASPSSGR